MFNFKSSDLFSTLTLLFLTLGSLLFSTPLLAAFEASVDRTRIEMGETITLKLSIDKTKILSSPDIKPLEESFQILQQHKSAQSQFSNGKSSARTEWIYRLSPKREGTLTLPALSLGKEKSAPLTIEVLPQRVLSSQEESDQLKPLRLELIVDQKEGVVQQQFELTLRLTHTIPIQQLAGTEFQIADVTTYPLGSATTYTKQLGDVTLGVYEQRYALFPQLSGEVTLGPLSLQAQVPNRSAHSPFSLFDIPETYRVTSNQIKLSVLPRPVERSSVVWLPASAVTLSEEWSTPPSNWKVGEPLTRTLILNLEGLPETQLPELDPPLPDLFKVYPDQSTSSGHLSNGKLVSRGIYRQAVIPQQPGEITLPPVEIEWFDTNESVLKTASIPAQTVTILEAASSHQKDDSPMQLPLSFSHKEPLAEEIESDRIEKVTPSPFGKWGVITLLFFALWLLTLLGWFWERRSRKAKAVQMSANSSHPQEEINQAQLLKSLKKAWEKHDAALSRELLTKWAKMELPEKPMSLHQWAVSKKNSTLIEAVNELEAHLYRAHEGATEWRSDTLRDAFHLALKTQKERPSSEEALPSLAPLATGQQKREG